MFDLIGLQQVMEQAAQIVGGYAMKVRKREHAAREFCGREFTAGGKRGHNLVIEQAIGKAVELRGLDPSLFEIELYKCDALQELPGDGFGQHRARLGLLLAHHEMHLGREVASASTTHALEERTYGKRRIDLESAL